MLPNVRRGSCLPSLQIQRKDFPLELLEGQHGCCICVCMSRPWSAQAAVGSIRGDGTCCPSVRPFPFPSIPPPSPFCPLLSSPPLPFSFPLSLPSFFLSFLYFFFFWMAPSVSSLLGMCPRHLPLSTHLFGGCGHHQPQLLFMLCCHRCLLSLPSHV